jgi:dTDP-4-dehydrorhamnose 3,5-epimerase
MIVKKTGLKGVLLIEPKRFSDRRGMFLESFHEARYQSAGITETFVQDNHSRSFKGVIRGLHFQIKRPQAQIVTVMRGRIFDVGVDLRSNSPTFGRWFGAELSDEGPSQIYMAAGFAHGFCVLSDVADLHYKVSRYYDADDEGGLIWNDPDIGISWPEQAKLNSARDAAFPRFRELSAEALPHDPAMENAIVHVRDKRKIWDGVYAKFTETGADTSAFDGDVWMKKQVDRVERAKSQSLGSEAVVSIAQTRDYALPFIAASMARRDQKLCILDVGGGMATSYFPLLKMLPLGQALEFVVVENESLCAMGRKHFSGDAQVRFEPEIPSQGKFDIVNFASSLHYIENWMNALERALRSKPEFLLFADLPAADNKTFVTAQNYYGQRIPVWFWNLREFIGSVETLGYDMAFQSRFRGAYLDDSEELPVGHFDAEHRLGYCSQLIFRKRS